ncbi:MAG TPA: D-xylose ABC transporter substrate-binding protein [Pyrinomonadaceae bacterium]|nr:D-xylose ABC transporter substrate-binding protein [Pyrinomonadaceae bacterium]
MNQIKTLRAILVLALVSLSIFASACVQSPQQNTAAPASPTQTKSGKIRIGLSMDTLKEERWQKDRDIFVKRAAELGAEVLVQAADGKDETQVKQAESLLTQGIDVLVVIPHNGEVCATIVEAAKRQNVPVISYDRLIKNSDVDLYISFDNEKVGSMQAQYLVDKAPKGNYILIGGAPTDNNAQMFRNGQMKVLQPLIDKGDIKVVADQWARDWLAEEALKHTENALTMNNDNVVAVVASNDGTAGGVVQALNTKKLSGKVFVSGQDADLAALQRIVEGTQSMTVYKPVAILANKAAEAAVSLAKKEKIETPTKVNNGKIDVPSILLEPISVDKSNLDATVIKDGFHKREEVYKNVPAQ